MFLATEVHLLQYVPKKVYANKVFSAYQNSDKVIRAIYSLAKISRSWKSRERLI
jgi:hypothetical protein